MNRFAQTLFLTAAMLLAAGTGSLSQGKKGQVQDPVCALWVDKDPDLSVAYKGETFYFCSKRDRDLFKANPAKYPAKK